MTKTAIRWAKSALTAVVVLAVMGGTLFLVPGLDPVELVRDLPFSKPAALPAAKVAPAAAAGAKQPPTRAPVQLSVTKQQLIGVTTETVDYRALTKSIRTVGKVTYDETRITDINLKVSGWIEKLFVDYVGKLVRKGQPVLTLYSPDLVTTQEEYLLALRTRDKVAKSRLADAVEGADALVAASRRRLSLWDITDDQIRRLVRTGKPRTYLTIASPATGIVVDKTAVEKMYVKPGMSLYRIADISTVWINAEVYEYEMPFIKLGQSATITLPYGGAKVLKGRITFIEPFLDPKTRTVKVRFSFPNPGLALRPDMYANVEIRIDAGEKLAVPQSAVLISGLHQIVFLARGQGLFEPREVRLGPNIDGHYVVRDGLSEGDKVVTSANFLLDSESRLMAATGGMKGMMSLIGMGDAPMAGAAMPGGMAGMDGMDGMDGMKGMDGKKGMDGMQGMEGMEPADGTGGMQGMQGMQGMEGMEAVGANAPMAGMEPRK